ncbi:unnamed protein product [Calicophoron daubneyi]|uniref:Macoilin n=1 Tax=Calicophoron daubneyi TaxID=300641 RepID=A0AAV2TXC2_CALDB
MYLRRRNFDHGRIKRNTRKTKTGEAFSTTFGAYFKILVIWATILMLDFFTDFRFEFIYSCWLFVRSVSDSFRYQGLAFALFFTLIAMTSDLMCYFLVPTTLVYLLGSSFVWVQLVWQADRGVYGPTVVLCLLFVYVEIAVRLRDPKNLPLSIDFCRPFAAHCIGYPAVTLGFGLKSLVVHHLRLRQQRSVEVQNMSFFAILDEALPKESHFCVKSDPNTKLKRCLTSTPDVCPTLSSNRPNSAVIPQAAVKDKPNTLAQTAPSGNRKQVHNTKAEASCMPTSTDPCVPGGLNRDDDHHQSEIFSTAQQPSLNLQATDSQKEPDLVDGEKANKSDDLAIVPTSGELRSTSVPSGRDFIDSSFPDPIYSSACISSNQFVDGKHDTTNSPKAPSSVNSVASTSSSSSSSLRLCTTKSALPNGSGIKGANDTKSMPCCTSTTKSGSTTYGTVNNTLKASAGTCSVPANGGKSSNNSKNSNKDEYTLKLEAEVRRLKLELQSLRGLEVDLRAQVQQLQAAERTYRSESSQARQEFESLQAKMNQLTQRLQTDRSSLQAAEKRLSDERKQRMALEQQILIQQQNHQQAKAHLNSGGDESVHNSPSTAKLLNAKSSGPSHGNSTAGTNNSSSCHSLPCTGGDSCAQRLKELESELRALNRDISAKDIQLAALKASHGSHTPNDSSGSGGKQKGDQARNLSSASDQHQNTASRRSKSDASSEKAANDLMSRLTSLQEENQRLTDTLKEEDKMKQELMTAYHSSLKEITELNAALTKKEYQIVELNMRMDYLTPHLCEYVNKLSVSTAASIPKTPTGGNQIPSDCSSSSALYSSAYSPLSSGLQRTVGVIGGQQPRRLQSMDTGCLDGRSAAQNMMNGLTSAQASAYFRPSSASTAISCNTGYQDCGLRNGLSPLSSNGTSVDNLISRLNNGVTHCNARTSDFHSGLNDGDIYVNTSSTASTSIMNRQPHGSVPSVQFTPGISNLLHFDATIAPPCNPYRHLPSSHPQQSRFKAAGTTVQSAGIYPLCGNRPLPVGSSNPTSSPLPFLEPPPGLFQGGLNSVLSSSSPNSSSSTVAPLEVIVHPQQSGMANLLHSPAGMEVLSRSSDPANSSSCLLESLSPIGLSSDAQYFDARSPNPAAFDFGDRVCSTAEQDVLVSPDCTSSLLSYPDCNISDTTVTLGRPAPYGSHSRFADTTDFDQKRLNSMTLSGTSCSVLGNTESDNHPNPFAPSSPSDDGRTKLKMNCDDFVRDGLGDTKGS